MQSLFAVISQAMLSNGSELCRSLRFVRAEGPDFGEIGNKFGFSDVY
jgi:hypothetical protein